MLKTKEARSMIKKQEKKKQSLAKARRTLPGLESAEDRKENQDTDKY